MSNAVDYGITFVSRLQVFTRVACLIGAACQLIALSSPLRNNAVPGIFTPDTQCVCLCSQSAQVVPDQHSSCWLA